MTISTLLIANRGEIARRIARSATAMGIRSVAVYVDADRDAPFVGDADEAVRLSTSYLDGDAVLAAARAAGADAIHPGYGFLSENADFAEAVASAGIVWVGPPAAAIRRMGDKLAAKALAEEAEVPILPGSENVKDAKSVGYPLLVKAAAGGGGKGMRIVESAAALKEAIASAQREAKSGFGDDRVFLERYVKRARHVEIQILGDGHGNLVHLGERECSIQRRHQKIIEESPSPRVSAEMRAAMGEAALRLGKALDYQSAGTVEFLVDDDSGKFYFLEVNTRLQVEHPVTELVVGIDLVREQLRIAGGEPLGYRQDGVTFSGAAVEARLYAEDPAADFLPATGTIFVFEPASAPLVRWDSGIGSGSAVGTDFDPMLAKVIAHAPTRSEAIGKLALALERTHIGGVVTNRDFLVATLRSAEFAAGDTTTDFIARVAPARTVDLADEEIAWRAKAAAIWIQGANRVEASVLASAPSGWRNARLPDQEVVLDHAGRELKIDYRMLRDGAVCFADGTEGRVAAWHERSIDIEIDGRRRRARVTRSGDRLIIGGVGGDVELRVKPRFEIPGVEVATGGLVAPMPGKVLEVRVAVGDVVEAGQVLVVLEAMKMEHPMSAGEAGVVSEVHVAVGDQVENGAVLLVVDGGGEKEA